MLGVRLVQRTYSTTAEIQSLRTFALEPAAHFPKNQTRSLSLESLAVVPRERVIGDSVEARKQAGADANSVHKATSQTANPGPIPTPE